jgi:hypothetical protein
MNKRFLSVMAGACIAFAGATTTHAQRIIGIQGSDTEACKVVQYNPFNDGVTPTGYIHDYSIGYIQNGSSTIDPITGRYFILTENKTADPNDDNNFLVNSVIRAVNTRNGGFVQYNGFETYNGPYQLEFSLQDGKLYGVDRGYVPGVRLLHFNPATGESSVIGTYDEVLQRQSGDKFSAFDSDNQRYIYLSNRVKPTFYVGTPTVNYINVETGELNIVDVTLVSEDKDLHTIFNTSSSHMVEAQYDNIENQVIALWCVNNQPTRIVKINEEGEMTILATYEAPSAGLQMVFDQATGRIVFQRMYGSDISNATGFVTVIDTRNGNVVSEIETSQYLGNWECDNSDFAALRFPKSVSSVNEEEAMKAYSISPNPSSEGTVTLRSTKQITGVQVVSTMGEDVYSQTMAGTQEKSIQVPTLASGTYMIRVQFADGTSSVRTWSVVR